MFKEIKIDLYLKGFNAEHIDCVNLPIAAAAGYYSYENYYYYSFYYAFFQNWITSHTPFLNKSNEILSKLGLKLVPQKAANDSEFTDTIKLNIDKGIPIFMIVKYRSLFYYINYLNNTVFNRVTCGYFYQIA